MTGEGSRGTGRWDGPAWPGTGWSDGPPGEVPVEPAAGSTRLGRFLPWAVPALIVFTVSLVLDALTIMPGLGYWDTGEFQALGPVLGIAHPTGYPSYTLLLWLASVVLQPFGEPAFRANLLSALLVSGAASLTAIAIVQLTRKPALAIAGGITFAVAPIAWRNALRADPHAFQVFLVGLLLVLLIAWAERERAGRPRAGRWLVAASAAFALAATNHGLTVALAPGVAVYVLLVQPRILWKHPRTVLACVATIAVLIVGIYAYLPLRSSMDPPLDYAHPAEWVRTNSEGEITGGFRYLVLGEQFGGKVEVPPLSSWPAVLPARVVVGRNIGGESGHDAARGARRAGHRGRAPGDPARPAAAAPGGRDDRPLVRAHVRCRARVPQRGHLALLPRAPARGLRLGGTRARRAVAVRARRLGEGRSHAR